MVFIAKFLFSYDSHHLDFVHVGSVDVVKPASGALFEGNTFWDPAHKVAMQIVPGVLQKWSSTYCAVEVI